MATRLLMIDDDEKLCGMVAQYLAPHGFAVSSAHTGPAGLQAALDTRPDVLLLDVMLPGFDGFELLRRLRKDSSVPVLMLTGLGEEADRIVGLEIGADDYLAKTFSTRELLARLRAVIRRTQANPNDSRTLRVQNLSLDEDKREVRADGRDVALTALEFDLLIALAKTAGRIQSRDQLLAAVAGRNYEVFDRSIDVHISSLRRKLGDDAKQPKYILTYRGVGYMLRKESE
jgi:DNA-binding response OmpR family regulator